MSEQFAGLQATFTPTQWTGQNTSGFIVYGDYVLVGVDECAATTAGGIDYPDDFRDRMTLAAETGCIFAVGVDAFRTFSDNTPWTGAKPRVGDRVYIEKYAGQTCRGRDGHIYRVMSYRSITAGLDPDYAPADAPEATET